MNGRVYDPRLGRFLQADPFVQAPKNSQNLNRYSYVLNNPLSYTDPSGYFFSSLLKNFGRFLGKYYRVIFAAVVSYATFGAASGWAAATAWGGTAGGATTSLGTAFAGAAAGAAGGFVLTGTLEGAIWGAVSGAALGAIGASQLGKSGKVLASGASGGILSELQGGKFGHGFVSAGVGFWSGMTFGGELSVGNFFASVAVAGTVSELTGGKFANGAVSAAMTFALAGSASEKSHSGNRSNNRRTAEVSITLTSHEDIGPAREGLNKLIGDPEIDQMSLDRAYRQLYEFSGSPLDAGWGAVTITNSQHMAYAQWTMIGAAALPSGVLSIGRGSAGAWNYALRYRTEACLVLSLNCASFAADGTIKLSQTRGVVDALGRREMQKLAIDWYVRGRHYIRNLAD